MTDPKTPSNSTVPEARTVAVTGSPNTVRHVRFDVLQGHQGAPLVGALVSFETEVARDGGRRRNLHLGQVTDATTSNRWHEDASYKDYLKRRGTLATLTGDADVTEGSLQVIGTYELVDGAWTKAPSTTPVGTGRAIARVDADTVRALMERETGYHYAGEFLGGDGGVPAPVLTRHFGDRTEDGLGAGEAFVGGVFGPAGSGKTVFGTSLSTIWARHPGMGFLFVDPQGEMRANAIGGGTGYGYDFHGQLERATGGRFDRNAHAIDVDQLVLEGASLFVRVLIHKGFLKRMGISPAKARDVEQALVEGLENLRDEHDCWKAESRFARLQAQAMPARLFPEEDPDEAPKGKGKAVGRDFRGWLAGQILSVYANGAKTDKVVAALAMSRTEALWDGVAALFDGGRPGSIGLEHVVKGVLGQGKVYVLDLNSQDGDFPEDLRNDVLLLLFRKMRDLAQVSFRSRKGGTNAMVVLDEAGLFVPPRSDDPRIERISKELGEMSRILRKLSVGLLLMTQRVSGIRQEIYAQMHFRAYGAGLAVGGDAEMIKSMEGRAAFDLYADLPDPKLSGDYGFMVAGALVALGTSGQPMFVRGFRDGEALMTANAPFLPVSNAGLRTPKRAAARQDVFAGVMSMRDD